VTTTTDPRSGPLGEYRVLFLHPAGWADHAIDNGVQRLRALFERGVANATDPSMKGASVRIVSGRDDWQAHVKTTRPGPRVWEAWTRDVAIGLQRDGQPSYHAYVCPWGAEEAAGPIGGATATILTMVFTIPVGKPVLSWNPEDDRASVVSGVGRPDPENNWRLILAVPHNTPAGTP